MMRTFSSNSSRSRSRRLTPLRKRAYMLPFGVIALFLLSIYSLSLTFIIKLHKETSQYTASPPPMKAQIKKDDSAKSFAADLPSVFANGGASDEGQDNSAHNRNDNSEIIPPQPSDDDVDSMQPIMEIHKTSTISITSSSSRANNDLKLLQELTTGKTKKRDEGSTSTSCPSPLQLFENRIVDPSSSSNSNTTLLHRIPKILHLSERSRCLNRDMYDALESWKKNFPSYSIFFHDDEAVDRLLLSEEGVYSDWRKDFPDLVEILPCVSQGAMKIDIWRVLVLYKFGGLYFDADTVPEKLTEDTINPDSSWFSLSDAWARPTQGLFATSAGHVSCKNTLQIIAKRVLDERNIQDIDLVHVTGPQALYWGWKDAIVNGSLSESEPHSTTTLHVEGKTLRFTDGSWGQKIEDGSSWTSLYWNEMVPFEKDLCVSRKTRTQKHFGRVHWTTAKGTGHTGIPRLSCRKHLESLHRNEQEKEHPDENISAEEDILTTTKDGNEALLQTNISDLILKNSNNATMCAQLAKENEEKKDQLRSSSTYCGGCSWSTKITCDGRMDYMISNYQMSVEDAFQYVIDEGGDNCKQK